MSSFSNIAVPAGGFPAALIDPPWQFKANSAAKPGRNPMRHYRTMSLADIAALPVGDLLAKDAAVFLWITSPFLVKGLHLPILKAWGLEAKAMAFVWVKTNGRRLFLTADSDVFTGPGLTTRKNAEFCILAGRGKSLRRSASVREVIIAERREHSRKPDETRRRIEAYCAGPYLELFARETAPGWTSWGNEVGKFDEAAG